MPDDESHEEPSRLGSYAELVFHPFPEDVLKPLQLDAVSVTIDLCEHVVACVPGDLDALKALGDAYTRATRYVEGLRIDKRLVALAPDDPAVRYNLACSYALLDLKDEAFEALRLAIDLGYDDFDYLLADDDLGGLRDDPRFNDLLRGGTRADERRG